MAEQKTFELKFLEKRYIVVKVQADDFAGAQTIWDGEGIDLLYRIGTNAIRLPDCECELKEIKELGLFVQPAPITAMETEAKVDVDKVLPENFGKMKWELPPTTLEKKKKQGRSSTFIPCPGCDFQAKSIDSLRSHLTSHSNRNKRGWWQRHKQHTESAVWRDCQSKKHGRI